MAKIIKTWPDPDDPIFSASFTIFTPMRGRGPAIGLEPTPKAELASTESLGEENDEGLEHDE
jgi:hypothetical protein